MFKIANTNGRAMIEYAAFIIVILSVLYVMRTPILNALNGKWKSAGETFGLSRQYDPKRTTECAFDGEQGLWYDQRCFEHHRRICAVADFVCEKAVIFNNCSKSNPLCADKNPKP